MPPENDSSSRKDAFIRVDDLLPRVSVEQVAAYYGVPLPQLNRVGAETRTRCFLACGRTGETGDRALAIEEGHPAKRWTCHEGGCGKSGNLVSLCDLLKPGESGAGRPRGQRFKQVAADLAAIAAGMVRASDVTPAETAAAATPRSAAPMNVPLRESANERARALLDLDRKFVLDPAQMPPAISAYFRRRPFLTPDVCRQRRVGYLPRDTGDDKSGGTMRGTVVYPWWSEQGELLTWFGRDPQFAEKHRQWETSGKTGREPERTHFVKGFQRGLELGFFVG